MVEAQSMTLEEFARLTARIDGGEPVERVLSSRDLDPEQWAEVQRTWLQRMAKRAAEGKPSLHQRFVALLGEQRRELAAERAAAKHLDGPLPEPPQERRAPVLVQRRAPAKADVAPPVPRLAPQRPAAPPPPPARTLKPGRAPTAAMPAVSPAMALPFAEKPAALPFRQTSQGGSGRDDQALPFRAHTAPSPASERRPDSLPFRAEAEPKPPPSADLGRRPASLGATMAMSVDDIAAARAALLPFLQKQKEQGAEPEAAVDLGSTAYVSPEEMAKARAALPFGAPPASSGGVAVDTAELPPDTSDCVSLETAEIPPGRAPASGALPFASTSVAPAATASTMPAPTSSTSSAAPPALSLEQYAWLCATIERSAARVEETLAWLRMSAEQKAELDARWREAMARDPALSERFDALRRSYLSQG